MLVKIEARILIFPGTDFHFPSTPVPPGTFLGSGVLAACMRRTLFSAVLQFTAQKLSAVARLWPA